VAFPRCHADSTLGTHDQMFFSHEDESVQALELGSLDDAELQASAGDEIAVCRTPERGLRKQLTDALKILPRIC